jgi:hypothetical protein
LVIHLLSWHCTFCLYSPSRSLHELVNSAPFTLVLTSWERTMS